jgi:alanine transaminase
MSLNSSLVCPYKTNLISERDGFPAYPENVFLTAGASQGVSYLLQTILTSPKDGILIPIPQYPLYTATLSLLKGAPIPYYLSEETGWSLVVPDLLASLEKARSEGIRPRAVVVINPGNPTGGCLQESVIKDVIELCEKENLVLIADEVYQTNIYTEDRPFHSFKKIVSQLDSPIELVSLHSVSKGMIGECGHRGGYFELHNFDSEVQQQIYKLASINLCPPIMGQIVVDLMVNPPSPGSASYKSFEAEFKAIYEGLKSRALSLKDAFNKMQGVECQSPEGAMYLFPRLVDIPEKAVEAAKKAGKQVDEYYCMRMLEAVGVCVIPGSGFGQKDGTWHYRTTFLASLDFHVADRYPLCILFTNDRLVEFHEQFLEEFK